MKRAAPLALLASLPACGGGGGGPAAPSSPSGPQMTVSGVATYEDRVIGDLGFTGQIEARPVRFAVVQLVAEDGAVLGETATRADGSYTLAAPVMEGRTVHVSLVARTDGQPLPAEVVNVTQQVYALSAPSFTASVRAVTQDFVARTADLGGVFNILDNAVLGADRVRALQPGAAFGRLRLLWSTLNRQRAQFNASNNAIQLRGHPEDPDEYDDPVILHEFGHYVADFFSVDTSPGGDHSAFDVDQPRALAWSEGFATWFGSHARDNPRYMDSFGTGTFTLEIETPSFASRFVGPGNEMAVAAALWDVSDPADEPHDALDRRTAPLWDVVNGYFRQARPPDVTVSTFCAGWFARGHGQAAELSGVFAHRGIGCP